MITILRFVPSHQTTPPAITATKKQTDHNTMHTMFFVCILTLSFHLTRSLAKNNDPNLIANAQEIIGITKSTLHANTVTIDTARHPGVSKLKQYIINTITTLDNNGIVVSNICESETKALNNAVDDLNPNLNPTDSLLTTRTQVRSLLLNAIQDYKTVTEQNKVDLESFRSTLNERIAPLNNLYKIILPSAINNSMEIINYGFETFGISKASMNNIHACESIGCSCDNVLHQAETFCSSNSLPSKCLKLFDAYITLQKEKCIQSESFTLLKQNLLHLTDLLHTLLKQNQETLKRLEALTPNANDGEDEERDRLGTITSDVQQIAIDISTLCKRFDATAKWTTLGLVEILATTEMGVYNSQEELNSAISQDEKESMQDKQDEMNGVDFHPIDEVVL
tara:strand:+ start:60 stop:1244 length:1185 start_codon:yes stop_codon:yes gene_type:complete